MVIWILQVKPIPITNGALVEEKRPQSGHLKSTAQEGKEV